MIKKIKFPLIMGDNITVRTIEELRENFDIQKIIEYFMDGKLKKWLEDRYYMDILNKLEKLSCKEEGFEEKICNIFDVEYTPAAKINVEEVKRKNTRILKLKEFTDDEQILNLENSVAFDQEELEQLLKSNIKDIYLCGNEFKIDTSKTGITYTGINNPEVLINDSKDIDLDCQNIIFNRVRLKMKYKINIKSSDSKEVVYLDESGKMYENNKWKVYIKDRVPEEEEFDGVGYYESPVTNLYRSREDGSNEEIIVKTYENIEACCKFNNTVFYVICDGGDKLIYKTDVNGKDSKYMNIKFENRYNNKTELLCNEKWIVWNEESNIYKANHNGDFKEVIGSIWRKEKFTLINNLFFYLNNNKNNVCLYRVNLDTNENISIDNNVRKVTSDGRKIYYIKYDKDSSRHCVCEVDINCKNKKVLESFSLGYLFNLHITRLEYEEGKLYYYTNNSIVISPETDKVNIIEL